MSSPLSGFSKEDEGFSTKVNKAGQWAAHGASKSCVQSGGEKGSAERFFAAQELEFSWVDKFWKSAICLS